MTAGRHPTLTFQAKLLLTLAGVTLLSVATVAALSINSIIRTGSTAKEVGGATRQVQIEEFLTDLIITSAEKTVLELEVRPMWCCISYVSSVIFPKLARRTTCAARRPGVALRSHKYVNKGIRK